MNGLKAKGLMLDIGDQSRFILRSLLIGVEKMQRFIGLIIDKEKRRSAELAVGEGL